VRARHGYTLAGAGPWDRSHGPAKKRADARAGPESSKPTAYSPARCVGIWPWSRARTSDSR
jgi:hypothetical protein